MGLVVTFVLFVAVVGGWYYLNHRVDWFAKASVVAGVVAAGAFVIFVFGFGGIGDDDEPFPDLPDLQRSQPRTVEDMARDAALGALEDDPRLAERSESERVAYADALCNALVDSGWVLDATTDRVTLSFFPGEDANTRAAIGFATARAMVRLDGCFSLFDLPQAPGPAVDILPPDR